MRIIAFLLILLSVSSCTSNDDDLSTNRIYLDIEDIDIEIITARKLELENDYYRSSFSFLQANESGLYVTPFSAVNDSVLLVWPNDLNRGYHSGRLNGAIRAGRGPNELINIDISTKTSVSDTLIFYSTSSAAYISIDPHGNMNTSNNNPSVFTNGSSLGYNNGYFLFPSYHKFVDHGNLLTIHNWDLNTDTHFFKPRVPAGYEPAIRNEVFPIGALPNGFAFSFLGDRTVYTVDFEGNSGRLIVLGESDPIPEPFKNTGPPPANLMEAALSLGSRPYITKIEFYREHLLILMDRNIWILEYPIYRPRKILQVKRNNEDETAPVIDFTINSEFLFLRIGHDGIYSVKTNQEWFD